MAAFVQPGTFLVPSCRVSVPLSAAHGRLQPRRQALPSYVGLRSAKVHSWPALVGKGLLHGWVTQSLLQTLLCYV